MSMLDTLIPTPRLVETDVIELAAPCPKVWDRIRHGDLGRSPLVRALFAARALAGGHDELRPVGIRIDDLVSSPERPGFQVLVDDPPHEVCVGAIGRVWQGDIPFLHVTNAEEFAAFDREGFVKVAWAVRVCPRGEQALVEIEVRVDATDDASWRKFRRYFRLIGPGSHFIRRVVMAEIARELGTPDARTEEKPLPGDDLLPDAGAQATHVIDIAAPPAAIWPWLVQMGCGRGGFYSVDALDNGGVPSAREIHPELQELSVGDVIPATPSGDEGFEVLRLEAPSSLVLGGLYDASSDGPEERAGETRSLPFAAPRPPRYWHVTWAFALEPLGERTTRLHARARAAFPPSGRLHAALIRPVHALMQTAELRHLAARAEGRLSRDTAGDVLRGFGGAAVIMAALLTPFMRRRRSHWGIDAASAERPHPGDGLVPEPRWGYTHGIEIASPAADVWPWVAQIGADRGGFYSYQWLENVAGCELRNAETVHPEWEVREGDAFRLHPAMPPLRVASVERGRCFVAHAPLDEGARAEGRPWSTASWLFWVEPLGENRCRFVSRFRAACSDDLAMRLAFGPALIEPVGFAMDRRMLMGVKERAERAASAERAVGGPSAAFAIY